ncbi:hypothetical protein COCVIDRAFT_88978, partial [Bipolaris victoriae FI3]
VCNLRLWFWLALRNWARLGFNICFPPSHPPQHLRPQQRHPALPDHASPDLLT